MKLAIIGYGSLPFSLEHGEKFTIIRFGANANYEVKYILSKGDSYIRL